MFQDELIARLTDFDRADPGAGALPELVIDASEKIAAVYAGLLAQGVDDDVVARAMMGATISLYDGLGLAPMLPTLLRVVADRVERELADPSAPSAH